MIILTKEILENHEQTAHLIEKEKALILSTIESQKKLKEILLDYMQKFVDFSDNITSDADTILKFLQNLDNSFALCNENIDLLNRTMSEFDKENINFLDFNKFNTLSIEANEKVLENTIKIESFLYSILPYSEFTFSKPNNINQENTSDVIDSNQVEKDKLSEIPIDKALVQNLDTTNTIENTLIISETKGKVFLPYNLSLLNETLEKNSDKYKSIEDIIEKDYTLPFDAFKNPAIARFKEAFKLVKNKEKKSIKQAFDLGMELFFNYNLHPAIISSCKNLDELDIYLDYLETGETYKFDCFKIIFDIAPVIVKK